MQAPATREAAARALRTAAAIRAACALVTEADAATGSVSVTFPLGPDASEALTLLRGIEDLASEFGLRQRTELEGRTATVHLWRG